MTVEKSLVSGSMTMLILKLLSEKDMYGYEMIDTLRQKSQNVFELKEHYIHCCTALKKRAYWWYMNRNLAEKQESIIV